MPAKLATSQHAYQMQQDAPQTEASRLILYFAKLEEEPGNTVFAHRLLPLHRAGSTTLETQFQELDSRGKPMRGVRNFDPSSDSLGISIRTKLRFRFVVHLLAISRALRVSRFSPTREPLQSGVVMARFHHFTYSALTHDPDTEPRLHQMRDGAAFCELASALFSAGHEYGTVIHCYPNLKRSRHEFAFLKPGDIVVLTTRPPLNDRELRTTSRRRILENSEYHLETAVLESIRPYFQHISRYCVELTRDAAAFLPARHDQLAALDFHPYQNGLIKTMRRWGVHHTANKHVDRKANLSAAYFLHLPRIEGYACRLIVSFGMSGFETLLWNRVVRLRYPDWLQRPAFALATMKFPLEEDQQPLTTMIADSLKPESLVFEWLEESNRQGGNRVTTAGLASHGIRPAEKVKV